MQMILCGKIGEQQQLHLYEHDSVTHICFQDKSLHCEALQL